MDRTLVSNVLEACLLLEAAVFIVAGINMPVYQAYAQTNSWGSLYESRIDVFGYEEPIFLFSSAAIAGLVVLAVLAAAKVAFFKKRVTFSPRSALPYLTVLLMIPPLVVVAGSSVGYVLGGVDVTTRIYVLLTPGIFMYMGGCLLLLIAQVVHLLNERGRSETPGWIVAWLAKNRITIAGSTLLAVFTLFTLRYAGSGAMLFSDAYPRFVYVQDPGTIVLMFFDLFPIALLLVPIGVDIMLIVIARNRFGRASSLSFPFGSKGGNVFRWMVWILPLFVLTLIAVLNAIDPPILLTRIVWPFEIFTDSTAYLLSGGALGLPMLLGLFVIFPVPLLWIADLIASQRQYIRG